MGYDARRGFLTTVDSYDNVLKLTADKVPDKQAVLLFGLLHELIKWNYYIGNREAQIHILKQFLQVRTYWEELSAAIDSLAERPKPEDMWRIAVYRCFRVLILPR